MRDFPGGSMVKRKHLPCRGVVGVGAGSIPGQGTKILHAGGSALKKKLSRLWAPLALDELLAASTEHSLPGT